MAGNIYFVGMIGSGKTTLGRMVAERIGRRFVDLDQEMDQRLGYSFHRLVEEQGWLPFRELEYQICKDFSRMQDTIVCLGGGTVRYEWNIDAVRGSGHIVLLEVSLDELVRRVRAADRPRVNPGTDLVADVQRIWSTQSEKYYRPAELVYRAEGKSIDQETDELITEITTRGW
ncbi:MAG: shikimate kinase [Spirochaetaceae bacterium]|nr:MAG: shikimate kinase [Spirochaetaceae bacterium]